MLQCNRLQNLSAIQKSIFHPKSHVYFCLYRLRCVCLPRTWDSSKLQPKLWLVKIYFLEAREMNLWQTSITEDSHVLKHQRSEGDVLAGYCLNQWKAQRRQTDWLRRHSKHRGILEGGVPHANQKSQEEKELIVLTTQEAYCQSSFINLSFKCQMSCNNSNNYTWIQSPPHFTYRSFGQKSVSATQRKQAQSYRCDSNAASGPVFRKELNFVSLLKREREERHLIAMDT